MNGNPLPLFAATDDGARPPLVLSYGMGVDSTAVLVGWRRRGIRPDLILFADTGSEHRATYSYRPLIEAWLAAIGFPPLTVVRYRPRHGRYTTIVEDCLIKGVLPSLAYGSKACSQKWKVGPQNAFLRTWTPAIAAWSRGQRLDHAIGYDAGPKDMRRGGDGADNDLERFTYPLREWGWNREQCETEIAADEDLAALAAQHGISPLPAKSACVCCPSTKAYEIEEMGRNEPEALAAALAIEAAAAPTLRTIEGLWRRTSGGRPGSWTTYVATHVAGAYAADPDIASTRLTRCVDPGLQHTPPSSSRYAVRKGSEIRYLASFRDALGVAGNGELHAWINGAWFTSLT